MSYQAFVLTEASRAKVATLFPPKFPEWIGHHVTHVFGGPFKQDIPYGSTVTFDIIGYAMEDGLEAFVVAMRDGTKIRPNGKLYHVTWSLDRSKGKKSVDSNRLIAEGYTPLHGPSIATQFELVD
jgi:hypothetical protein